MNNIYLLAGSIELDEGFFATEIPEEKKKEALKRSRGSQKKNKGVLWQKVK